MKCQFSEFSYGYAFIEEFLKIIPGIQAAPIFPSLREEARLGYDVRLNLPGLPIFIQFKRSECLTLSTAKEYGIISTLPFYRMPLMSLRYSQQHNLLVQLNNRYINSVFYVTPSFYRIDDFNNYYLNNTIVKNSIFLEPFSIGIINDTGDHHISFNPLTNKPHLFSEPVELKTEYTHGTKFVNNIKQLYDKTSHENQSLNKSLIDIKNYIFDVLYTFEVIKTDDIFINSNLKNYPVEKQLSYILQSYFNIQLFIVQAKGNREGD